jgi:hypothetical protein
MYKKNEGFSSEVPVLTWNTNYSDFATYHNISDDSNLHYHCYENLKSHPGMWFEVCTENPLQVF